MCRIIKESYYCKHLPSHIKQQNPAEGQQALRGRGNKLGPVQVTVPLSQGGSVVLWQLAATFSNSSTNAAKLSPEKGLKPLWL